MESEALMSTVSLSHPWTLLMESTGLPNEIGYHAVSLGSDHAPVRGGGCRAREASNPRGWIQVGNPAENTRMIPFLSMVF